VFRRAYFVWMKARTPLEVWHRWWREGDLNAKAGRRSGGKAGRTHERKGDARSAANPPGSAPWRGRDNAGLAVLVAALALLPYLNSLTAGFALDDLPRIVDNPMVQGKEPAVSLLTWVDRPEIYRPLTMLTFAANGRLGTSAMGYHAVNVLVHALVTVFAFQVARIVLRSSLGAAAAAALFAVHPIHTEAVTNVFGRAELLAALFVLICLLALARASRDGPARPRRLSWFGVSLVAFAAGLVSKESAVTAIALCGVVHVWVSPERRVGRTLRVLAAYGAVGIAFIGWRRYLVGALGMPALPHFLDNPLAHVALLPRLATALVVVGDYLRLLTFPLTLSSDYSFNQVPVVASVFDPRLVVVTAVLVLLALALVASLRRAPALVVAGLFFFVPLAATANILVVIGTIKAERLLYLPSFGWCLVVGWLVTQLARRRRPLALGALGIMLCLFAARSWVRNADWRDESTAHAVAVRTAPASAKTHYNRARDLIGQRRLDEAIHHLRRSLAIYPEWSAAQANLGGALALTGNLSEASTHLAVAARLDPASAVIRANLSQVLLQQGRLEEALAQLEAAKRLAPPSVEVSRLLGTLYLQRGRLHEAVDQLTVVVSAEPDNADARNNLGVALLRLGRVEEAIPHLETALRIRPGHPQAQRNLHTALAQRTAPR
jgi:tetratricopeptide (TPR) repeat protein